MRIEQATRDTCGEATGAVVAIDVIRAFTTAAFAFAAGARDIVLVGTVEEAFAQRERFPGALAMGEVDGLYSDLLLHDMGRELTDPLPALPEQVVIGQEISSGYFGGVVNILADVPSEIRQEWRGQRARRIPLRPSASADRRWRPGRQLCHFAL